MPLTMDAIRQAQARIAPYALKTPLLRMECLDAALGCQVYVKAECMQRTGSFKLRGAMNRALTLTPEERARGIVAASSGNHGRAISYAARLLGAKATVVMPRQAPEIKIQAIRALGAEVILCETSERFRLAEELCASRGATMVPPFNDETVMAGQGTVGLEIMEACPDMDVIVTPTSGGGLLGGVATAVRALSPRTRVYGAEPAAMPRYGRSLEAGAPVQVPQDTSIADALLAQSPGGLCFSYVQQNAAGVVPVEDAFLLRGMKLLLTEGKLLGEPSACIEMGAALQGVLPVRSEEKVCFVVSGGNAGLSQLHALDAL